MKIQAKGRNNVRKTMGVTTWCNKGVEKCFLQVMFHLEMHSLWLVLIKGEIHLRLKSYDLFLTFLGWYQPLAITHPRVFLNHWWYLIFKSILTNKGCLWANGWNLTCFLLEVFPLTIVDILFLFLL